MTPRMLTRSGNPGDTEEEYTDPKHGAGEGNESIFIILPFRL